MASSFYTKEMACAICETRRPRRFCPGVHGDICSICCGTEREVTVDCPLDCEYLREGAPAREARAPTGAEFPNRDIQVTEKLLRDNELLLTFLSDTIFRAAMEVPGAIDCDVREALDGTDSDLPHPAERRVLREPAREPAGRIDLRRGPEGARRIPEQRAAANSA